MSVNVAMLKAMQAEGLTFEQAIRILEAGEPKQSSAAVRQKRYRDNKRNVTRDVTPPLNESILNPPDIIPPKANALDPRPKKHRLPDDWQPKPFTPGSLAAQTVLRWEPGRLERELSKFKDHHAAAGTRWENWQAAWSKWVNNSEDFQRGRSGTGTPNIGKSAAAYAMLNVRPDEAF